MITSIFSKSKPINLIIVVVAIALVFVIENFDELIGDFDSLFMALVRFFVLVFSVFVLDFIVSKNKLTQGNSYALMTFGLLVILLPKVTSYSHLLFSNLFILFATRRLISLHSNLNIKKKLFDAGFWIALASLIYFWAILFFAIVIVALIYYSQNNLKNILVPFMGLACLLLIFVTYNIVAYDAFLTPTNFERYASLDFTPYNSKEGVIKLTVLFTSFVWVLIYFFKNLRDKNKKLRPSYFLVAWSSLLAILVAIIAPEKNGSEFIFFFAPFSIIMANYLETVSENWFREVFPIMYLVVAIVCLML